MSKKKLETADVLAGILGDTQSEKSKKKLTKPQKIIIAAIAILVVTAMVIGIILGVKKKNESANAPVYREYTAMRGDIIVGLTESSVITLNKEDVTFPVGTEVLELFVKSGSQVNEGDKLARLDTDDIEESLDEYEEEIQSAYVELENAKLQRKSELLKAQQTLESNNLSGSLSGDEYSASITQAKLELTDAQNSLEKAQNTYNELKSQSLTFSSDLAMLNYYEARVDTYQDSVDRYTEKKNEYNELSSSLSSVENEIRSIADASNMEQANAILDELKEEYDNLCESYSNGGVSNSSDETSNPMGGAGNSAGVGQTVKYSDVLKAREKYETLAQSLDELEDLFDEAESLEKKLKNFNIDSISESLSRAEKRLSEAKEDLNEFNEKFNEKYGNIKDSDEMNSQLKDAETSLEKAKLSLEKQQTAYQTALLSAEQKKESTDSQASSAQKEYNLTKIELDQKVNTAQKQYDSLVEDLNEIKDAISNDGIITASCSGIVSSLNIEVGDDVSVSSGNDAMGFSSSSAATLMTITDMKEVNVSISVSEDDILDVYLDQEAVVTLAAFPDDSFDAIVDSISVEGATIGAASVSYTVNVKFTQDTHELYDGMSADVTLIQGSARDAIYISEQAVTVKDGVSTVLVKAADGSSVETQVTTGFSDGQYIEILSGINEGDTVLVQSALGGNAPGDTNMPDMGDFDMENMPDMGDMGNFNPGAMQR